MSAAGIADKARELAQPMCSALGLELWDVLFVREGRDNILRIIIDKPDGVNITDCEALSREIDPALDEADFIDVQYTLEVSSPGLGRTLRRPEHFERMAGRDVIVSLYRAVDGKKEYSGALSEYNDSEIALDTPEGVLRFAKGDISKVKLDDDF